MKKKYFKPECQMFVIVGKQQLLGASDPTKVSMFSGDDEDSQATQSGEVLSRRGNLWDDED